MNHCSSSSQHRVRLLSVLILSSLTALFGCKSAIPPEPPDLGVEVPEEWTALSEPETVDLFDGSSWWRQFDDENLDLVVTEALANNRNLLAASARVDAAVAQARIAGADLYPQIGVGVTGSRQSQNFVGFPIPGREQEVLSVTFSSFGANLNISWEADLWGRLRAQKDAAVARVEASQADYVGARLSLAGQAAKSWFAAVEAHQQVELAEATLESRRVSRKRIERRYRVGTRPALDLRFAVTNQAAAEATLALRRRQLDGARRQLQVLLSRYPDGDLSPVGDGIELAEPPAEIPPGLPAELVTRRPDLLASENRMAAAGLDVAQARANLYPRLRLTASGGTLSADIGDLLDDNFSVWSLAANILQPVFQGGRLRAGVELSEARLREVTENYVQQVLQAFGEVESALAAERFLAEQERALFEAAKQSIAADRLANDRYEYGLDGYLTVLEAQRNSFLAQSQWLSSRRQRLDTRIDLNLALGGDFHTIQAPSAPTHSAGSSTK
jgi:multidrug efflux system outer membrane protein